MLVSSHLALVDRHTLFALAPLEFPISAPRIRDLAGKRAIYELGANDAMQEVQDQS
jgi:hypothetical protein